MTTPPAVTPLTPAEHRSRAEADLAAMRQYPPSTESYRGRALSAVAHVLAAIACYLEPPPEPDIPGLPPGWGITTRQKADGDQKWGYQLTAPDGASLPPLRCLWKSQELALAAGISDAKDRSARAGVLDEDPGPGDSETRDMTTR